VPSHPVAIAVALADKLDALTGFFAVGEKPTGSGDPFALRRAALGIIRILIENKIRISLLPVISGAEDAINDVFAEVSRRDQLAAGNSAAVGRVRNASGFSAVVLDVLSFFADRLKVALKEKGIRHDLIDAVFSLGNEDDLVRLVAQVEALQTFLKTDDGKNLLAGYKRAANILKVEEKKDGRTYISEVDESLLPEAADKALHAALAGAIGAIGPKLDAEDFAGAMREMAALRGPVDGFFEAVKVNADDPKLRENRLHLLAGLRAALHRVADFSRIEG
jgi:glycyl-tRNA synthetase beta chain